MVLVKRSVEITALPREVWPWIVEPGKYLVWNTDFRDYRILEDKEGGVGTTFHMAKETRGGIVEGDGVVTEWVENRRYAFQMEGEQATAVGKFTLEPMEQRDTGCRLTFEEDLELKGLMGKIIGAFFLKRAKAKNMEQCLGKLKRKVEGVEHERKSQAAT